MNPNLKWNDIICNMDMLKPIDPYYMLSNLLLYNQNLYNNYISYYTVNHIFIIQDVSSIILNYII